MAIFYIHGFGSCAQANHKKLLELQAIFPRELVYMLDYDSAAPYEANLRIMLSLVREAGGEAPLLIGTSLGGLYARAIREHHGSPMASCAVFNPVTDPLGLLTSRVGWNMNYCTESKFELSQETAMSYADYWEPMNDDGSKDTVFIAQADEILNAEAMVKHFTGRAKIVMIPGGHRVESLLPFADDLVAALNPSGPR